MLYRNILANYIGKLWAVFSVYLFIPLYIRLLGVESYGVIAFHNVVLALMLIADAGLVPAFGREMARSQDRDYLRSLLRTMEILLGSVCAGLALVVAVASPWISAHWLKGGDVTQLAVCVALLGATSAMQLAMSLYTGGLMGLQRQTQANAFGVGFSFVRSACVLLPLWLAPDLRVYFAWQVISAALFLFLLRRALWRELEGRQQSRFDFQRLRPVFGYALGMMGMSIVSALNTQTDKLVTSFALPLRDYAVYSLASVAGQAPMLLTLPVAMALLPRFTQHVARQDTATLQQEYVDYSRLVTLLATAVASFCFLWSEPLLLVWTSNPDLAAHAAPVLQLLLVGSWLLALQLMPFHLSLANGHNATNLRLGVFFLVLNPLLTFFLARHFGLVGAAIPWIFMNATAFLYLGYFLHRRFLPAVVGRWFTQATLWPALTVMAGIGAVSALVQVPGLPGVAVGWRLLVAALLCGGLMVLGLRKQVQALRATRRHREEV